MTFLLYEGMGIAVVVRDVVRNVWHAARAAGVRDGWFSCSSLISCADKTVLLICPEWDEEISPQLFFCFMTWRFCILEKVHTY